MNRRSWRDFIERNLDYVYIFSIIVYFISVFFNFYLYVKTTATMNANQTILRKLEQDYIIKNDPNSIIKFDLLDDNSEELKEFFELEKESLECKEFIDKDLGAIEKESKAIA